MPWFHDWFSTKGRKAALGGEIRELVLQSLTEIAAAKSINLVEAAAEEDHVHLLLEVRKDQTLAAVMHQLKGTSSRRVLTTFPEIRWDMKVFWQKSYGWRQVAPEQLATVRRYIATQEDRPLRH